MTWVRTDDSAPYHGKFFRVGVAAYGWWHAALSFCNRWLSDGFLQTRDVALVFPGTPPPDVASYVEALVRERALHVVEVGQRVDCSHPFCRRFRSPVEGYLMHDYSDFQPLKKTVQEWRRAQSQAGRKGGETTAKRYQVPPGAQAKVGPEPPSRPVPTRPDSKKREALETGQRARTAPLPPALTNGHAFEVPAVILDALRRCPKLGVVTSPAFWQAELRANPGVDYPAEILRAEAWLTAHPERHYRKLSAFLHNWLARADRAEIEA